MEPTTTANAPGQKVIILETGPARVLRSVGETAVLRCVPAKPSYRLTWLKNDQRLDQIPEVDSLNTFDIILLY